MAITHAIVRRGIQAASDAFSKPQPGDGEGDEIEINPIALLVMTLTFLFFALVLIAVSTLFSLLSDFQDSY